MNPIDEMNDVLMHYGTKRHSGRYPWGSGENPYQHSGDFLARIEEYQEKGMSEKEIAEAMGISTTKLRVQKAYAVSERRQMLYDRARSLKEDGYNNSEIARMMGFNNESSIRSILNEDSAVRMNQAKTVAEELKKIVDEADGKYVDIGPGVERELGVSRTKFNEALYILELEGYPIYSGRYDQVTNPGKKTTMTVLCPPGTQDLVSEGKSAPKEIFNPDNLVSARNYSVSYDDGDSFHKPFEYPASMDSKRLMIRYGDEGGELKDGVIELRRGVKDLDLGGSNYAQVRILVDGDRYLKGMAVYSDDLPDGVDVRFNTNKKSGTAMRDVLKPIHTEDPNNPFGSLIKEHGGQSYYDDPDGTYTNPTTGKKQSLSLINKRSDEGDWGEWANKIPSQFLSKQPTKLIERQLGISIADKEAEYDSIMALTNPTVKKKLLLSFADDCDSTAVHLKAASLPRQRYQVILPLTSISDTEVYAPNYEDGETVALVRYPHGGTFEIPILKVNNKNSEGKKVLGSSPKDGIGISKAVADRLSGADFDGDTVAVIPVTRKTKIASKDPLKDLKGFDAKVEYGTIEKDGEYYNAQGNKVQILGKNRTQTEMGIVSNLITDMTLLGADDSEIARAVKHSMTIIDANKHKLDYKQSEKDNGIKELKTKYQGHINENGNYVNGAATLISRAKSETSVLKRQGSPKVNIKGSKDYDATRPEGVLLYKTADDLTYMDRKTGKTITRTQKSTKMAETDDARTLISEADTVQEELYARYANQNKELARKARVAAANTKDIPYDATAKKTYQAEVDSLTSQVHIAELNAPRERRAQIIANSKVKSVVQEDQDLTKAELKKVKQRALSDARASVGAKRNPVSISDKEWEAIQAGAVSKTLLEKVLSNTDMDRVKELATPRSNSTTISASKQSLISIMHSSGYTNAEIAKRLNVSVSTVAKYS